MLFLYLNLAWFTSCWNTTSSKVFFKPHLQFLPSFLADHLIPSLYLYHSTYYSLKRYHLFISNAYYICFIGTKPKEGKGLSILRPLLYFWHLQQDLAQSRHLISAEKMHLEWEAETERFAGTERGLKVFMLLEQAPGKIFRVPAGCTKSTGTDLEKASDTWSLAITLGNHALSRGLQVILLSRIMTYPFKCSNLPRSSVLVTSNLHLRWGLWENLILARPQGKDTSKKASLTCYARFSPMPPRWELESLEISRRFAFLCAFAGVYAASHFLDPWLPRPAMSFPLQNLL